MGVTTDAYRILVGTTEARVSFGTLRHCGKVILR